MDLRAAGDRVSRTANTAAVHAIMHELFHISGALARLLRTRRQYMQPLWGADGPPTERSVRYATPAPAYGYDPRFLLFEFGLGFILRRNQVHIVRELADTAARQRSCVRQMIMGAGKTSCVAPLLVRHPRRMLAARGRAPAACCA